MSNPDERPCTLYHEKKTIMICLREGVCAPYHDSGCGVLILGIPGLKEFFVFFEMEECTLVGLAGSSLCVQAFGPS